jgi:cardiolipin synthase
LRAALPVGLLRMLFYRVDLRMHRKIVVIDGEVAYTGSLNLVDPRYFQQDKGVGQWIDAMVRVQGPAVETLGITFLEDWELETGEGLDRLQETGDVHDLPDAGTAVVQTIPSGPVFESQAVQDVLLMTIYAARREIILTSPYFVPDEVLATALATAAQRGVDVTVIVPARNNHFLVQYASQAFKGDLIQAGVRIALFDGGLLHTKSATVDGEFAQFGSLNLDARSLHLNFEITLAVYDAAFTNELRDLQRSYLEQSTYMDLEQYMSRPLRVRFLENTLRLLSPLL